MSLRSRITLWQSVILLISLGVMAMALRYELREDRELLRAGQPVPSAWEETGEFLLSYGLPTAVLLLLGSAWLIRRSLKPVARLTEAAERIQLHHLQEKLPPVGTGDELDRLTEVFNSMTARLQESFDHVREFTLHASHELKTPLTVMRGELEIALRDERCAGEQRELLASLLDELQRLSIIVDSLTLLAKADAGQMTLKMEALRFDELFMDSFADVQMLARPQGITVTMAACDQVTIEGERYRLRQLLLILADNAVKYNQPKGEIEMSLKKATDSVEITIANTGPGIPPEILPRVFDRFFRGDPAHGNAREGCGLGLTIAKWIVQAHRGTIQIDSSVDGWTTAKVSLPLAQQKAP